MVMRARYCSLLLLVVLTVVFVLKYGPQQSTSPEIQKDPSNGYFTYKDWVNSEKEIDLDDNSLAFEYSDCLRITFAGLWPAFQHAVSKIIYCKDRGRGIYYQWSLSRKPYPPHLAEFMKIPSFWRDHKQIYQSFVSPVGVFYRNWGKSKEEIIEVLEDSQSYEAWINMEKKIKFDDGRNMTYEKCVKMEFGRVWDEEDEAQRQSRVKCKSMALEMFSAWVGSNESWPPQEFFNALMKVPSFWRNHTQIYNYIIRPAQFYNYLNGKRRPPHLTLDT